jgi:aminoglycoside 6'-N-acetyltransferase
MAAEKDASYGFRSVGARDLGRIQGWLNEPHVRNWFGEPGIRFARIRDDLDSISTEMLIVEIGGHPAGFVQVCDPHLDDNHPYSDYPTGTLSIECFLGDPDLLGKGIGSGMLRELVTMLFEEGAACVLCDPSPANENAKWALAAAGFRPAGERLSATGPVCLMVAANPEFDERGFLQ